jgi:hypothetical protein
VKNKWSFKLKKLIAALIIFWLLLSSLIFVVVQEVGLKNIVTEIWEGKQE